MNEKEILLQLKKIRGIKPDKNWKKENRDVLLSQVYGSQTEKYQTKFNLAAAIGKMIPLEIFKSLTQPVMAVFLIVSFLFSGGILSLNASRGSKPGDSLYIAKIVSEKAQIALTFDDKKKAQLGLEFAGNRAEELTQILAEEDSENSEDDNKKKNENVEKLVNNFKKEISGVKSRLEKIAKDENQYDGDEELIFSASIKKDENGIQISGSDSESDIPTEKILTEAASSTAEILESAKNAINPEMILIEAKNLLSKEDYQGTLNSLEEADKAISQINSGEDENKEDDIQATSTEENLNGEENGGEVLGAEEASATSTEK